MIKKINNFWELFKVVAGGTSSDITKATEAIARSDKAKVESYFSKVIDQFSFSTPDYNRLRKFLIDLYATHRTQSSVSLASTDPRSLTNSDLDELFRSMGYPLSSPLRGFDENPLQQKVNFFLDLISLYKVKGTPQSLVDILQYYGVTEVDIYEFFLKKNTPNSLIFDGKVVSGTSLIPSSLSLSYRSLTEDDPHWLYTENQILNLFNNNQINFPSKSPYFAIQPIVNLEGAEISILQRYIQDQYEYYQTNGVLPPATAEVTYFGETRSLLELYLVCIYTFNKLFTTGSELSVENLLQSPNDATQIPPWASPSNITLGHEFHDGSLVAHRIEETAILATHNIYQSFNVDNNEDVTITTFFKAAERNVVWFAFFLKDGSQAGILVNLSNGSYMGGGEYTSSYSIVEYPNGWYRVDISGNVGEGTDPNAFVISLMNENNDHYYTGVPGNGCLFAYPRLTIGEAPQARFLCYDGLLTDSYQIMQEFNNLTSGNILQRSDIKDNYNEYLDLFTRNKEQNFLINRHTATEILNIVAPDLKELIDISINPTDVLFSLLRDLSFWVRSNIGFGFVDFGFILFGIEEFFKDLKPIINFFKPYRARVLLLESLQIKNRLFNTIFIEDRKDIDVNLHIYDFLTANGEPCCNTTSDPCLTDTTIHQRNLIEFDPSYIWKNQWGISTVYVYNDVVVAGAEGKYFACLQPHTSGNDSKPLLGSEWETYWKLISEIESTTVYGDTPHYSRETFDCGSFFDVGAVTDIQKEVNITIEDNYYEVLKCPHADNIGYVTLTSLDNKGNLLEYPTDFTHSSWYHWNDASIQADVTTGPDGIVSASKFIEGTTLHQQVLITVRPDIGDNEIVTFSGYLKVADTDREMVDIQVKKRDNNWMRTRYDLDSGEVELNDPAEMTSGISYAGNGFYRIYTTFDVLSGEHTPAVMFRLVHSDPPGGEDPHAYTGDGTSGVYIWGAQLERGEFTGVVVTNNLLSLYDNFTGDDWGKQGPVVVIPEATTGPTSTRNILEYSEDFTDDSWYHWNDASIQANATTGPDGIVSASKFIEGTTLTQQVLITAQPDIGNDEIVTFSGYLKVADTNRKMIDIQVKKRDNNWMRTRYDLDSGEVELNDPAEMTSGISSAGNGFYRIYATFNILSGEHTPAVMFRLVNPDYPEGELPHYYTGDGISGVYIWGAQLERGTLSDYQKRDGPFPLIATKMDETNIYAQFMLFKHIYTFNDNEIITISAYAKAAERDLFFIMLRPKSEHWAGVHFNLTTGTITHGTENFINSGIESVGNGWYRVWATRSVGSGSNTPTIYYGIKIDTSYPHDPVGDVNYNGTEGKGLYIWGPRLEIKTMTGLHTNRPPLLYSENFTPTIWVESYTSISTSVTTAPDGVALADQLVEDTTSVQHLLVLNISNIPNNNTMKISCYFKPVGRNVDIGVYDRNGDWSICRFDLNAGTVISSQSPFSGDIWSAGNGYFLCSVKGPIGIGSESPQLIFRLSHPDPPIGEVSNDYTGDGTSGVYIWAAKLEKVISEPYYCQMGGFRNFDEQANFDCTYNNDAVFIIQEYVDATYLQLEDGSYVLKEDGGRIKL